MPSAQTQLTHVGAAITAQWLRDTHSLDVEIDLPTDAATDALSLVHARVDGRPAVIAVIPLFDPQPDPATAALKQAWETRLADLGVGPSVVWVPPGAPLTPDPGDVAVGRIAEALAALGPSERGEVQFPVQLVVRREGDEGSYLNVLGGLQPHWARFTNQVLGRYRLDADAIHRLPDDPQETTKLIDLIVLIANGVRTVGKLATIDAVDTWALQRLPDLTAPAVLVAPPGVDPSDGLSVRRALRRGIRAVQDRFAALDDELKIVTCVGLYRSLDAENAGIALKGMDPTLFGVIDFACLAADAALKPLFGPRPGSGIPGAG